MTLTDSMKLIKFAIEKETVPGTVGTTPDEYVYLVNDETIKVNRTFDTMKPSSQRDLVISAPLGYSTSIRPQIWAMPQTNGLGHFLTGAIGSDSQAQQGGTTAYLHTISLTDTILPSYTIWSKSGIYEKKSTYNQINRLTINSPQNKEITVTAEFVGGKVVSGGSDFGSASYSTLDPFKSSMGSLLFGNADDKVRSNMTEFNLVIDNGIRPEEGLVHGKYYPSNIIAGNRTITGDLSFWMEDDEENTRFWDGLTDPTATEPGDTPALIALECEWIGGQIASTGYYYTLDLVMDKVQLNNFDYVATGNRIAGKASFTAIKGTGTNLLKGYLTNARSTAY